MPDSLLNYMESLSSWYSYMKNFFKFQTTQEMLFGTLNKKNCCKSFTCNGKSFGSVFDIVDFNSKGTFYSFETKIDFLL